MGFLSEFQGFLGAAYLWVKAAHVTFVIFWIAGLFIVPRYFVHHQATTPGSAEDRAWIEREDKARTVILAPAMALTWVLGLMLAVHLNVWDQYWFMAKLLLVVILSGYNGWIGSYAKKLAKGHREVDDKKLRLVNELPGILTAIIVVLVIVRPF